MVGYMSVNPHDRQGFIDWEWLGAQPAEEKKTYTSHLHLRQPFVIKMNGRERKGVILKPSRVD